MEDGQTRYFRRVADGVYDLQDLQRRTCDLSEFVALAAVRYGFAGNQVMALGFSNGANMAASLLFNGQEDTMRGPLLAGAALLHPRYLVEPKTLPDLKGVPIFVGAGESDPQVPWRDTQRLANWLSKAGAAVTLSRHPGVHRYTRPEIEAAIVWAKGRVPGSSEGFGSLA
jgi:phospholipase/carboxylesterase